MKIDGVNGLISVLSQGQIKNICILDNNSIGFLLKVESDIAIEEFFKQYDLVLLPKWVEVEVNDGYYRKQYISRVAELEDILFCCVDEFWYLDLLKGKDGFLFKIFSEICRADSNINSFMKRDILNGKGIEDLPDYEEWLGLLYDSGFQNEELSNKRNKKKNAGEISICVLSYIISKFYEVDNVTTVSQDGGTYYMTKRAEEHLGDNIKFEYDNPITFKSNDFIINEFYKLGNLKEEVHEKISNLRSKRKLKFTRVKEDGSIEERWKIVDNDEFIELLQDNTLQIIF
ncbi:hypothetical protein KPL39_16370 [Clostridium gasigenes]|uniref:hypothetical protein n=1 Tax=Clostridium gasigenes TaxID=94869 RepID=UPI001C0B0B9A|nr:hypothetical protein [Clostridium gasigenes]MBU3137835.1 hypothetical protein [Clostridium gasigenes]